MFLQELRHAARQLLKRPGYALLSVLVLAGGLGSTLFMLSAIDAFILKPLPFPHADRLVHIGAHEAGDDDYEGISARDFAQIRAQKPQGLEVLAAYGSGTINIADDGGPERYDGAFVTHDLFPLIGEQPVLGRAFTAEDDKPGAPTVALLSDRVWRDRYHADPGVVGKTIRINAQPATIIGVMPPKFAFPFRENVWIPLRADSAQKRADAFWVEMIGRVAPGTTYATLAVQLRAPFEAAIGDEPEFYRGMPLEARDLKHNFVSPQTSTYLGLMFATALCVLLVACANVANLLLSQMAARHREIAVRAALGAGRRRLLVHVLAECFLIALLATGIGLVAAKFGGDLVMDTLAAAGDGAAWFLDVGIDARLVVYSLLIACVTTLLAGLAPALRAAGEAMQEGLREGGKGGGTNGGFARFSRGLVVAEVAISCVLLIGAGASVRSLRTMMDSDIGTDTPAAQLLTGRIGLFPQAYPTGAEQVAVFERIVERLAAEPGVRAATAASILPGSMAAGSQVAAYGEDYAGNDYPDVYYGSVGDGFARTYGIELVAGRVFDARDTAASEKVTVVDVRLAERLFPGRDPLGQRIKLNPQAAESEWRTIVGVVANLSIQHLEGDPAPTVLTPLRQDPVRFVTVAVHLDGDVTAFGPRLAEIVREVDADTPVYWVRTHARALEMSRVGPMVLANIFGIFGVVGLVLAGAGLYGVLSFAVAQRTREIGLRRAIGAESSDIVRAITSRSAWQVGLGLAIGLALGVPWSMLLAHEELGVAAIDPLIFGSVIATIALAALLSSLVPARRALGVEPIQALRWE